MDTMWILLAVVLVCAVGFVIYLIRRNQKDKENVIGSMNETELLEEEENEKEDRP